jgi:superoxide reductase
MERRAFIRLVGLGGAAGVIAPQSVLANPPGMAGGVYYTKDAPGRWSKKVGGHLPNIEVAKGAEGTRIQVVTSHEMRGCEHYIVKHVVLDQNYAFLMENLFDPMKTKAPVSEFDLGKYTGRIHVLSMCNIHDLWMNVADV